MVGRTTVTAQASRLDQFCAELIDAVKVSEDEVAAASSSDYQYDRVRLRIAEIGGRTKLRRSVYDRLRGFGASLLIIPRVVVLSSAAAILVALVVGLVALRSAPSSPDSAQTQSKQEDLSPIPDQIGPKSAQSSEATENINVTTTVGTNHVLQPQHRRVRSANRSSEVATEFLPLTYVDDLGGQQSGHIVRMKVPRSALIAFGVPMNMERAGELITADVMIGDDGLARAIRFVQ